MEVLNETWIEDFYAKTFTLYVSINLILTLLNFLYTLSCIRIAATYVI